MIAIINTLLFIISIAWFIVIASAIFSWLYAFNVINANNQVIATIGRALYNLTEPVYRPIRRILPDFGGVDLSPMCALCPTRVRPTGRSSRSWQSMPTLRNPPSRFFPAKPRDRKSSGSRATRRI